MSAGYPYTTSNSMAISCNPTFLRSNPPKPNIFLTHNLVRFGGKIKVKLEIDDIIKSKMMTATRETTLMKFAKNYKCSSLHVIPDRFRTYMLGKKLFPSLEFETV